jgi:hypothetical protein
MPPDDLAGKMIELQEFTNLIGIPASQHYFVTPFSKLHHDRQKKRDVRRIIQINPDLPLRGWYLELL